MFALPRGRALFAGGKNSCNESATPSRNIRTPSVRASAARIPSSGMSPMARPAAGLTFTSARAATMLRAPAPTSNAGETDSVRRSVPVCILLAVAVHHDAGDLCIDQLQATQCLHHRTTMTGRARHEHDLDVEL